jgi:hypothetical protein
MPSQLTRQKLEKFIADTARLESVRHAGNESRLISQDIFKSQNTQTTSRTKEVKLVSTRRTDTSRVTLDIMLQPPICGLLPMELHSLMNYQNVTQNSSRATDFFAASPSKRKKNRTLE